MVDIGGFWAGALPLPELVALLFNLMPRFRSLGLGDYSNDRAARTGDGVLAVLVHGDGAFSGQVVFSFVMV